MILNIPFVLDRFWYRTLISIKPTDFWERFHLYSSAEFHHILSNYAEISHNEAVAQFWYIDTQNAQNYVE